MQNDVTDGVQALIKEGLADAHRVCIVGGSYGGYAALAGAAFTPDLYACAASINGVTDLPHFYGYIVERSGDSTDATAEWLDDVGPPTDPNVIGNSPARAAQHIQAPILLVHSTDDSVVTIKQSEEMAAALKRANKSYRFEKLVGNDHWLSRGETRIKLLQLLQDFLQQYLPTS